MSGVKRLLEELQDKAREELDTPVKIENYDEFPDFDRLRLEGRQWVRLKDVVAVVEAFQRALCAGVTLKTFGQRTVEPATREKMEDTFPKTRLKVGMHSGVVVVKKVGLRDTNEPVWAAGPSIGRPSAPRRQRQASSLPLAQCTGSSSTTST